MQTQRNAKRSRIFF